MWGPKQEKTRKPRLLRLYCWIFSNQSMSEPPATLQHIHFLEFTQTTVGQLPEVLRQADVETQPSL